VRADKVSDIHNQPIIGLMPSALSIEYVNRGAIPLPVHFTLSESEKPFWIVTLWRRIVAFVRTIIHA
jgi:hypothetical protein